MATVNENRPRQHAIADRATGATAIHRKVVEIGHFAQARFFVFRMDESIFYQLKGLQNETGPTPRVRGGIQI